MVSSRILFFGVWIYFLVDSRLAEAAPNIFDMFEWGLEQLGGETKTSSASSGKSDKGGRKCVCDGSWCRCCVDLSLSGYIDIGGPGCVDMKYISQDEGVKVNISYGDNLLHGPQVKADGHVLPICMDLLSDLAQVCASMKNFQKEGEGLRGCASLEPTLLGDVQDEYKLGCFTMNKDGIIPDPENSTIAEPSTEEAAPELGSTSKPDVNEETLIAAVNQSAEEGIAWFSSLLGLSFGGTQGNATQLPVDASSSSESSTPISPPSSNVPQQPQTSTRR